MNLTEYVINYDVDLLLAFQSSSLKCFIRLHRAEKILYPLYRDKFLSPIM